MQMIQFIGERERKLIVHTRWLVGPKLIRYRKNLTHSYILIPYCTSLVFILTSSFSSFVFPTELDRTTALPMVCFPDGGVALLPLLFNIPAADEPVPSAPACCITRVNCFVPGSKNLIDAPCCDACETLDVGEDRISPINSLGNTEVAEAAASASASRWPVVDDALLLSSVFTTAPTKLILPGLECDTIPSADCSPAVWSRVTKVVPSLRVTVAPSATVVAAGIPLFSPLSVLNVIVWPFSLPDDCSSVPAEPEPSWL